jgi:chromosome segregation ATPase
LAKEEIDLLESSDKEISSKITDLKTRRDDLKKQLELLEAEIVAEEKNLNDLPKTIEAKKSALAVQVRKAASLHKKVKNIPGSSSDDQQAIDEVENIRLRALNAVQGFLGVVALLRN